MRKKKDYLADERWVLLKHINELTEPVMPVLGFIWVILLILEFTRGLSPFLDGVGYAIWALFIFDFIVELVIAPSKTSYLKRNVLTAVSLVLPVLRVIRIFRLVSTFRAVRSVRLLRLLTSLNRGINSVRLQLGSRGFGYVVALTTMIIFGGAAGILLFENPRALQESGVHISEDSLAGIRNYGDALWWTAMLMTTIGSDYWPKTVEGRILTWLLSVYAFAIFGYITATIASIFLGKQTGK